MSKKFKEVKDGIIADLTYSKKGKIVKTFSRSAYDDLLKGLLNEAEYETTTVKFKNGELVKETVKPVEKFRKGFLKKVLLEAGVDKHEVENLIQTYEFTNVDGFYDVICESLYQYMDAGKRFTFPNKEDFQGSLVINEIEEQTKDRRVVRGDGTVTIKSEKHKSLRVKGGGCPKWLKKKLDKKK